MLSIPHPADETLDCECPRRTRPNNQFANELREDLQIWQCQAQA